MKVEADSKELRRKAVVVETVLVISCQERRSPSQEFCKWRPPLPSTVQIAIRHENTRRHEDVVALKCFQFASDTCRIFSDFYEYMRVTFLTSFDERFNWFYFFFFLLNSKFK